MLTPSQLKYGVLGRLSAARQKIQYRNFQPTCGDDAVVHGIDDQVAYLTRLLDRGNMEMFLKRLNELMLKLLYGPLRGRGLFVPELDELVRRASLVFTPEPNPPAVSKLLVHVATEVYLTGGHTRVIEDIAVSLPEYQHTLVLTGICDTHPDFLQVKLRLEELGLAVHVLRRSTPAEKATELSALIKALRPRAITLFAHPADTAANAGVAGHSAQRVAFFHHVDHYPCLGPSRTDYMHIDLTPACHRICASHPPLRASMVNLTVKGAGTVQLVARRPIVGATCGSPHKYAGSTEFTYGQLLAALFSAGVFQVLHIGDMPEEQRDYIRAEIATSGQDAARVVFLPNTPSLTAKLLEISPDFYLVSHPIGSGKATLEAMSVGLPVLHVRPASALPLLAVDMTFGASVTPSTLKQIPEALRRLEAQQDLLAKRIRETYEKHYSPEAFREAVRRVIGVEYRASSETVVAHADR